MRIQLEISEKAKPSPEQSLDKKVARVSRIENISGYIGRINMESVCAEKEDNVQIAITHISDYELSSRQDLNKDEFKKFREAYGIKYAEDLITKTKSYLTCCSIYV